MMTWFKLHLMRQTCPLLSIDSNSSNTNEEHDKYNKSLAAFRRRKRELKLGERRQKVDADCCLFNLQETRRQVRDEQSAVCRLSSSQAICRMFPTFSPSSSSSSSSSAGEAATSCSGLPLSGRSAVSAARNTTIKREPLYSNTARRATTITDCQRSSSSNCNLSPASQQSKQQLEEDPKLPLKRRQSRREESKRMKAEEEKGRNWIGSRRGATNCSRATNWRSLKFEPLTGLLACLILLLLALTGSFGASSSQQQHFEVQPEAQYLVQNGHDIRLRCLIRNRQGECLWLRNGRAIGTIARKYQFTRQPDDGDCSLSIRNVTVQQDDGQWQCQVTASDVEQDTLQSREVNLVVLVPPERPQIKNMSQNTQRLILEENKTKFVVCEMRGGNPAPQIEWILDNKNISKEAQSSSFQSQSGSTSQRVTQSKLKVNDIKRTMNGKNLTCVGVHQTLNQSTSVELDVQYVPTVSVVQREYSIVEGSPLSISCQVDSNPPPNIVNWRLVSDGSAMASRSNQANSNSITSPTRAGQVLQFERISRDLNQNVFECLAQNSYGISLPADIKLNVLYAPSPINTSQSESVALGSQAQLACLFDGNPEPEIKWHYTDPLSRSAMAVQLDNNKQQQYLTINNVTYRNEGDYHCEARNQINGVNYGVRSSNIILDVFGEPQFLAKSPTYLKAVQGTRADLALTFCSDPPPNKVYWQFGSLRLDVRLNNNGGQPLPPQVQVALAGGNQASRQSNSLVSQRFQVHPLQSLQKRDSSFSKIATCFEAQLSLLDPELTDQRDYTLIVQNERGHQSSIVRLRVSSPLSPVLMITSAFITICGLFLCSLIVMFIIKRRNSNDPNDPNSANGNLTNGGPMNGKAGVEHLVNGSGLVQTTQATITANGANSNGLQHQQQTRGIVNGAGNGVANGASNPASSGHQLASNEAKSHSSQLMSMVSTSNDSSASSTGDQKQLLASSPDRTNSSSSSSSASSSSSSAVDGSTQVNSSNNHHNNSIGASSNAHHRGLPCVDTFQANHSTTCSTPSPMNHISVEDEMQIGGGTYQAAESVTRQLYTHSRNQPLIYTDLDYRDIDHLNHHHHHHHHQQQLPHLQLQHQQYPGQQYEQNKASPLQHDYSPANGRAKPAPDSDSLQSEANSGSIAGQNQNQSQPTAQQRLASQAASPRLGGVRSSVGATIAMMNSLAAAAAAANNASTSANQASPGALSGALNGAINQQFASGRQQVRKAGPPKPPKPLIQQRSRFYLQQQQQQNLSEPASNENGLMKMNANEQLQRATGGDCAPHFYQPTGSSDAAQKMDSLATTHNEESSFGSADELALQHPLQQFPAQQL